MTQQNPRQKRARVVAELGRPETPEEAVERRARNSRAYRESKTPNNLVVALVTSLVVMLFIVLVVVRPDQTQVHYVDYRAAAAQAQSGVSAPIASPDLPSTWLANSATLGQAEGSAETWHIGFITPRQQFIALEQGIDATDAWLVGQLGNVHPGGTAVISGVSWTVYDQRSINSTGNFAYSIATRIGASRYLLHGTAPDAEFRALATAIAAQNPGK